MARRYRPFLVTKNDERLALELSFYFFLLLFFKYLIFAIVFDEAARQLPEVSSEQAASRLLLAR